jgi:heme exporter protein A
MSGSGPFQDKPSLRVEDLSLARGGRVLFEGLSFAVDAGGYVEVHGANGSGKTSLLRALAGFLKPRAGRISYANVEEPATALHFIGHANALKREASVRDHVQYWEGLFGARYEEAIGVNAAAGVAAFGLIKQADLPVRALSQGQARRLSLMRLHIAPRPVWLLDEPAAGLDAAGREMLGDFITSHCLQGGIAIAAVHEALGPEPSHGLTLA